jgi:ferric-dicitrate binding protein FerR (iron transport regulator)
VTHNGSVDRERVQGLMMAAMDGEISATDRIELDALLAARPEVADEWRRLTRLKEVTATMSLRQPPEEIWDHYWHSTYRRAERGLAWVLVSAGAIVLAAYGIWHAVEGLLQDTSTPPAIRAAIAAVGVGAVILVVSVLREKLFMHRRDPYQKEIIR